MFNGLRSLPLSESLVQRLSRYLMLVLLSGCGAASEELKENLGLARGSDDGSDDDDDPKVQPPQSNDAQESPLSLRPALKSFESCAEAEAAIEDRLVKMMRKRLEQQLKWQLQVNSRRDRPADAPEAVSDATNSRSASGSSGPNDFTTTNNQVAGVEEADVVKNTGTHIYHLATHRLHILKSWPASEMASLNSVEIDGRAFRLLLDGDRLVVLAIPRWQEINKIYWPHDQLDVGAADVRAPYYNGEWASGFIKAIVYDVSDPANPQSKASFLFKGRLQGARRIGSSVRLILGDWAYDRTLGLKYYLPHQEAKGLCMRTDAMANLGKIDSDCEAELRAAYQALGDENEQKIREATLEQWLATDAFSKTIDGTTQPSLDVGQCQSVYEPNTSSEFGLTRVVTLNLDQQSITEAVLLSYTRQLYSSQETLYLANPYWWWNDESRDTDFTFLHAFDVSNGEGVAYLGSGGVQGTLLNQFAMDEYKSHLRVATTITSRNPNDGADELRRWIVTTKNRVSTMALKDGKLEIVGKTRDLAEGERIMSARFYGDRGFLVTFRQIDPLFTVDLTDPTAPKVVGELKIPGFSSYMHMIDDDHLLAIGRDGDMDGRISGLKLSIFDVSDMTAPTEAHIHKLEGADWSQAQWDHKAFTYFAARKKLAIPATGYDATSTEKDWWRRYSSRLMVFDIDASAGISHSGNVEMNDIYIEKDRGWGWWSRAAQVNRSIFADDFVYAISNLGIRAVATDDLTTPVSTVKYSCDDRCFGYWWWY